MRIEDDVRTALRSLERHAPDPATVLRAARGGGAPRGHATGPRAAFWRRGGVALAAAASVLAVIAASLVLTSGGGAHGRRPAAETAAGRAALASVPPFYIALTGTPGLRQHAVVRATATGAVLATITPPKPYRTFRWLSGASDDHTFVLGAQRYWRIRPGTAGLAAEKRDNDTPVKFFRLRLGPAGQAAQLTALPLPEQLRSGQLAGIGLSPDGSKLAVELSGSGPANAPRDPKIQVITLATGSQREWVWPGSGWLGNFKPIGVPLSWTADGRMLEFQQWTGNNVQVRVLDTTTTGRSLRSSRLVVRSFSRNGVFILSANNTIITPDGTKVVASTERFTARIPTTELRITEFSVSTGKPVRLLDPWQFSGSGAVSRQDVLWTNSSGSTLIVESPPGKDPAGHIVRHGIRPVAGVLTGGQFTPLPKAPQELYDVAW
jgi:hypothetical protein